MTERRRRPHPAIGARWVSAGLAVSATVAITGYLEIDSFLHPRADVAVAPPPATAPLSPSTTLTVPPAPQVTVRTIPSHRPPLPAPPTVVRPPYVPPTHARTRGSNG